jgi:Phosphate transporter family
MPRPDGAVEETRQHDHCTPHPPGQKATLPDERFTEGFQAHAVLRVRTVAPLRDDPQSWELSSGHRSDHHCAGVRHGQTISASLVSLAHGTNDAQKTMGVITLTLISTGALAAGSAPPYWVIASAGLAIGLGTYIGG